MSEWDNFFVVAGGASAALTGLVFVAVSLNIDRILNYPVLRKVAAQTLILLVAPLFISLLMVVPGSANWVLGAELMVGGILVGLLLFLVGRGVDHSGENSVVRLVRHLTPNLLVSLFIALAGVAMLILGDDGTYLLVPAIVLAFIGGVANAWLFVIRVTDWSG